MSNTPVYFIGNFTIEDSDTYRIYEKGFFPLLKKHGGQFITFDDQTQTFEGSDGLKGRVVVFKFPNEVAAQEWYNDPSYQLLSEHRRNGTSLRFLTMVHGIDQ